MEVRMNIEESKERRGNCLPENFFADANAAGN
jgi:hypothetical protein